MDFSENARELELEESEYRALLQIFKEHLENDLLDLSQAFTSADFETVYKAAHSIKGASGSLNLWAIYDAASEICTHANQGVGNAITGPLSTIRSETKLLSALLNRDAGGPDDAP